MAAIVAKLSTAKPPPNRNGESSGITAMRAMITAMPTKPEISAGRRLNSGAPVLRTSTIASSAPSRRPPARVSVPS